MKDRLLLLLLRLRTLLLLLRNGGTQRVRAAIHEGSKVFNVEFAIIYQAEDFLSCK